VHVRLYRLLRTHLYFFCCDLDLDNPYTLRKHTVRHTPMIAVHQKSCIICRWTISTHQSALDTVSRTSHRSEIRIMFRHPALWQTRYVNILWSVLLPAPWEMHSHQFCKWHNIRNSSRHIACVYFQALLQDDCLTACHSCWHAKLTRASLLLQQPSALTAVAAMHELHEGVTRTPFKRLLHPAESL
jgi:hypothetical protein